MAPGKQDRSTLLTKSMLHHKVETDHADGDRDASAIKRTELDVQLPRNMEAFSQIAQKLVKPKDFHNIIEEYIRAQNSFSPKSEESQAKLLSLSRQMAALLKAKIPEVTLAKYAKQLEEAAVNFLDKSSAESQPNRKVFSFFENITYELAKGFNDTPQNFRSNKLWNKLLERYFLLTPSFVSFNPKKIVKLVNLATPVSSAAPKIGDVFFEPTGKYKFQVGADNSIALADRNEASFDKLCASVLKVIEANSVKPQLLYPLLEALSRGKGVTHKFIESPLFTKLIEFIVLFEKHDFPEQMETLTKALTNCFAVAIQQPEVKKSMLSKFHADNLLLAYISNIDNNREDLIPSSVKLLEIAFEALDNKSAFFEKKFVEQLAEHLGGEQSWAKHPQEKAAMLILLGRLVQDPSLDKQF